MAGTIFEFFGYRSDDLSLTAKDSAKRHHCPFIGETCEKTLNDGTVSGACSIKPVTAGPVIACPIRLYADDYKILRDVADQAFEPNLPIEKGASAIERAKRERRFVVAVFGKRWGGELRLPQKEQNRSFYVDWILALITPEGDLQEFVAIEVQTIDTTGNYRPSRSALLTEERATVQSTVGLNWENVNKRILPQLIYKGQLLQREELCRKGLFFVIPQPVYNRIVARLGGVEQIPPYRQLQPASITFLAYDIDPELRVDGHSHTLGITTRHSTTVYKLQQAFNDVPMPRENIYRDAISVALGLGQANT